MCNVYSVLLLLSVCYALIKFACARYYKFDPIYRFRARPYASRASCCCIIIVIVVVIIIIECFPHKNNNSPDYDVCDLFCLIFFYR